MFHIWPGAIPHSQDHPPPGHHLHGHYDDPHHPHRQPPKRHSSAPFVLQSQGRPNHQHNPHHHPHGNETQEAATQQQQQPIRQHSTGRLLLQRRLGRRHSIWHVPLRASEKLEYAHAEAKAASLLTVNDAPVKTGASPT